jgi:type IV pilus assembly protein PilW
MTLSSPIRQRGFGIVEIMVALVIGLVLTAGVFQFYFGSKRSYRLEDALSRVQETGRFAMNAIARDVRMVDFWGCGARVGLTLVNDLDVASAGTYFAFHQAVAGDDNTGLGGSDALTLRYGQSIGVSVRSHDLDGGSMTVDPPVRTSDVKKDDYVVLCNPVAADIFQVTDVGGSGNTNTDFDIKAGDGGNVPPGTGSDAPAVTCQQSPGVNATCFARAYNDDAEFAVATQRTYFIQNGVSGQPGLFLRVNGDDAQELIEGVENMQVLYGEDTDGDRQADRYIEADAAGLDMDNVVSVRVALLVSSVHANVTNEAQPVTFNGATVAGTDRRLRQVFTATLTLRNRVL